MHFSESLLSLFYWSKKNSSEYTIPEEQFIDPKYERLVETTKTNYRIAFVLFGIVCFIGGNMLGKHNPEFSKLSLSSSFPPNFPYTEKSFHFMEGNIWLQTDNQTEWDIIFPSSGGFVLIDEPQKYGLPSGVPQGEGPDGYGVSVFHQLHCLKMIKEVFFSLQEGSKKEFDAEHVVHCFDYIRQSLMCCGDTTIEWAPDGIGSHIDGYDIPHKNCKDWDSIFAWTVDHQPLWSGHT